MQRKIYSYSFFASSLLLLTILANAQKDIPTDYLSKEFHKSRRDAARELMPDSSVMLVFAAPLRTFSNDVEYLYHQNPDLYYFTGYKEPHAVLLIYKEIQTGRLKVRKFGRRTLVERVEIERWLSALPLLTPSEAE